MLATAIAGGGAGVLGAAETPGQPGVLRPASSLGDISDEHARLLALFREAGKVISSQRCLKLPSGRRQPDADRYDAPEINRVSCAVPTATRSRRPLPQVTASTL